MNLSIASMSIQTMAVPSLIAYSWQALGVVWLIGLTFTKRTLRTQPTGPRLFQAALALLGFFLLGSPSSARGWLAIRFLPANHAVEIAGLAITIAGCIFAIWARLAIGSNWSGRATVKVGHQLVTTGPYALARHPIYTGLLLAGFGTALAIGQLRGPVGLFLVVLALLIKMSQEERLMLQTFPQAYPAYRNRVKALIPGIL